MWFDFCLNILDTLNNPLGFCVQQLFSKLKFEFIYKHKFKILMSDERSEVLILSVSSKFLG